MASGQPGSLDPSGQGVKLEDTFTLLESQDLAVVKEIRGLILVHLSSGKEPWLANSLVDYYYSTNSVRAKEILVEIREPFDKILIEKILEGLRTAETRLQAMQLLLYAVNHQPPWTHRLADRPIFPAFLKCLKTEVEIPVLMTGVMTLVILLPVVPVSVEAYLHDIFDIFARIAGLIIKKPANSPDIFMLHLNIGLYVLFLRLYGMFPCTFITFLSNNYSKKENLMVYSDIIAPILDKVRLHPNLILGSKDVETSKGRWRKVEPQDIVVNCAKLSMDPIEGTTEDLQCPIMPRPQREIVTIMKPPSKQQRPQEKAWQEKMEQVSEMFPVVVDPASYGFSPSQLLSLATPPTSQRATPAASFNDQSASLQQSTGGTMSASPQIVTPTPEPVPREMPVMGDDMDKMQGSSLKITPVPSRSGPKTTPVNRTHGSSAFTSPILLGPTTSQPPSVGPSPLKPVLQVESVGSQVTDSGAARTLVFESIPEGKEEAVPRHIEMRLGKDTNTGAGAAGPVPMEPFMSDSRRLSSNDSDPLDQEVRRITEAEDESDPSGSFSSHDDGASDLKQLKTADSVIQFMKQVNRIRFNSLTSHNSEPLMLTTDNGRPGRPRSCPPFRRKAVATDLVPTPSPNATTSTSTITNSRLDTVSESAVSMHGKTNTHMEMSFLSTQLSRDFSRSFGGSKDGSDVSSSIQTRVCSCQCAKEGETNLLSQIRQFASVFQCMLAPITVAVCRQCQHPLINTQTLQGADGAGRPESGAESWISWPSAERALYSVLSPPELLDRHLLQGSELHAKELAHIPLTSQDNVSWTHFGGCPPVDEVNILRGEILLLQNQLMYERHKRSNHAMRNRRLLRRIAHVSALEQQVQALTDQLDKRAKDIQNLQVSLKLLQDHNHRLQQTRDSDEYEKLVDFKTTIQQNKDFQEANIELKNLLLTQKAENDDLKTDLQQVRAKCFELEKDNEIMCGDMAAAYKWKDQVIHLQKEMLLMGEAQERLQNHLDQQQRVGQENTTLCSTMLIQALRAEIKALKEDRAENALKTEAALCRVADMEDYEKNKDKDTRLVKTLFEECKAKYAAEVKAVEDKYQCMIHVNQVLEAKILELQSDNACMKQQLESSKVRASRRRDDRGESPRAGSSASHESSPAQSETETKPSPMTRKQVSGEGDSTGNTSGASLTRRKHGGQDSLRTSSHSAVLGTTADFSSCTTTTSTAKSDSSVRSSSSKPAAAQSKCKAGSFPPKDAHRLSFEKRKASLGDHPGDATSESSDGPQGLAESRAMMYTDSEDNGSQSSNSNFTSDSGVYSKVEPAN